MKKYIILCIALLSVCYTQAQENIYLHKKNGNIEAFALEQVDSAIFSSSESNFAIISPKDTIRIGEKITMKATKSNDKDLSVNWYAEDPTIVSLGTLSQLEGSVEGIVLGSTMIYASSNGDIANTPLHVVGKATSLGETEIYWDLVKKEVQSGNSVPFWAQYDSKDKIDHTEIWYDINEVVSRKATCRLIPSIKYEYADTVIILKKKLDQVKDFAHSELLWDASVQANHLSGEFPVQLHDSLLSSMIYSMPRKTEDLEFYTGTEFLKAFKDNLTPRMNYDAYREAFVFLGMMSDYVTSNHRDTLPYLEWMTDSTFDANSARWIKDFKQYDSIFSTTIFDTIIVSIDTAWSTKWNRTKLNPNTGNKGWWDTLLVEVVYNEKTQTYDSIWWKSIDTIWKITPIFDHMEYVYDDIMDRVNRTWRDSVTFLNLILGDEGYDFTYKREYVLNTEFRVYEENDNVLKNSDSKTTVVEHDNYILNITSASNTTVREAVAMNVELNKHYASQALKFECIFPKDAKDEYGSELSTLITTDIVRDFPKSIRFWHVGSQQIKVKVYSGNELIDIYNINIQVGYDREVPTLYYAEAGGNIMAYKLVNNAPADMNIVPFDLGVRTQHAFNLLFKDESLYVLDAGKQFYYVDDVDGKLGDGKISVLSKDGSKVETMISNVGGPAFQDPFYGYVDGDDLYYSDRNQGIIKLPLSTRDAVYNAGEHPYYVNHNTLGYYNCGIGYGAIGGMFGKINGVWHWTKFYNGYGIFRFQDSDILPTPIYTQDRELIPKAGIMLDGMSPKSFVYVPKHYKMLVHIMDAGYNGVYVATYDELESVGTSKNALRPYKLTYEGKSFESNTTGNLPAKEGMSYESVGITQMAYDEVNDCVYFAYRNNSYSSYMYPPTGIYSYNMATGEVTCLIEGVEAYGLTVNNTPSKLF